MTCRGAGEVELAALGGVRGRLDDGRRGGLEEHGDGHRLDEVTLLPLWWISQFVNLHYTTILFRQLINVTLGLM